ncbi:MAG TPA: PAS domain S-box protein [Verrucomicrobiae bacterium]|jgi:PAS domain S-box-containing protein|nr:PAS domain S-box protein [Verrucomicrobiae bacterium]
MDFFLRASIKRKQVLIIMITTTAALLLACAGLTVYEIVTFRSAMVSNLSTLGEIIGNNTAVALEFSDPKSADETLSALKAETHIVGACVYSSGGKAFATYRRPGSLGQFTPPEQPPPQDHAYRNGNLALSLPIISKGEAVGSLYLVSDIGGLYSRLGQYALIMAAVFGLTLIVALGLSNRLQKFVSEPIRRLAVAARAVAQNKDYTIRVEQQNPDEIGVLISGFNGMLEQIQLRDSELQKAKDVLEGRVKERTLELAEANAALQRENLERKQAEETLRSQEERTRLIVDRAFDALITTDGNHRIIGWNMQAEKILGWTRAEIVGRGMLETFISPRRRQTRRVYLERFHATGEWPELNRLVETTVMHCDGHEVPVEFTITPIRLGDGWIFTIFLRDITERMKAQAELQSAHQQLVRISRQAGMAEVATSVLHNVGNVLNSINVAATVVEEMIRQSRISDVARLSKLLDEHAEDRIEFLTRDPKGQKVPVFLGHLAQTLATEQTDVLGELTSLRKNVEHVKEIIAMQQSYARVSGLFENIDMTELLEDTVRMNAGSLERHEVKLVRDYAPLTPICTDKHKVLQILINLVRNAKYACDESGKTDKQVILRMANGGDRIKISVIDNGVGIPAENLRRIFNHGFTTRQNGHGFGLHSGALAARELGGSLTVSSEGPGLGAAFTLELPCVPPPDKGTIIAQELPRSELATS